MTVTVHANASRADCCYSRRDIFDHFLAARLVEDLVAGALVELHLDSSSSYTFLTPAP